MKNSNPSAKQTPSSASGIANKDFQDINKAPDQLSKSEKDELKKKKQRIHNASTTPDKNHVG